MRSLEILPWVHHASFQIHQDLLDYVSRIPKRSIIFLELDYRLLEFFQRAFAARRQDSNLDKKIEYFKKQPTMFALFELYSVCKDRGLNIVPLELPVARSLSQRNHDYNVPWSQI